MKKYIFSLIFVLSFFLSHSAFASMTFSPSNNEVIGTSIDIDCTSGNSFIEFNLGDSSVMGSSSCPYTGYIETVVGTYTFVECDPATSSNSCGSTDRISAEADSGYVSTSFMTFTGGSSGTVSNPVTDYIIQLSFLLVLTCLSFYCTYYLVKKVL